MVAAEANDRQGTVGTNPAAKADSAAIEAALAAVRWGADGLIAAIAQDADDGTVLMVAWMNREALAEPLHSGRAVYWSRSRQQLWRKGECRAMNSRSSRSTSIATATPCFCACANKAASHATPGAKAVFTANGHHNTDGVRHYRF
jgi:hypothetical protein